jgi:hypothetical protein
MTLKKILKNKKGIALETAIWFMLAIAALSTLLISLSLIGNYQIKIEKMALQRKVEVDQIGEIYISYLETHPTESEVVFPNDAYDTGKYRVQANSTSLTVYRNNGSSTPLLYVEAERGGNGTVIVKTWRYSLPD